MVQESDSEFQKKHPALQRWADRAGIHVAGDHQLAIIDRYGQFHCFKGPGQFTIYRIIGQTIRGYISLAPIYTTEAIPNIRSNDGLLVNVKVSLAHALDPRPLPRETALKVMKWPTEFREKFMLDEAQSALQTVVSKYSSHQIASQAPSEQIKEAFLVELKRLVSSLGITLALAEVREMIVPDLLQNRLDQIAQRTATIEHLREHHRAEYDRALRVETVEALPQMSIGKMFVNPAELTPNADQDDKTQPAQLSPGRTQQQLPKGKDTNPVDPIEGEVLSDDEPPSRL